MNVDIKMPDLATTDSEVTIIRWLVEVGQPVKLGEPLLEIETDKASMEVEAVVAGTLQAIHVAAGEQAGVGQVIATIKTRETTAKPESLPVQASPIAHAAAAITAGIAAIIPMGANQREVARRMLHSKQTIPHFYLTTSANAERMST